MKKVVIETYNTRESKEKKEPITLFFSEMEQQILEIYMAQIGATSMEEAIIKAITK